MEEPEVSTEHLHEDIVLAAGHSDKAGWITGVALSSALLAAMAAVCSLLAGHHVNEAMVEQIQSSDKWAYYQAKGIKAGVLSAKIELLEAGGKSIADRDRAKLVIYAAEQDQVAAEAKEKEQQSVEHLHRHVIFARGVTLFQIAIAVGAISALTRRRTFWFISLMFGTIGIFFLCQGWLVH